MCAFVGEKSQIVYKSTFDELKVFLYFLNRFHDKSAQTDCSKEMWIPILKRLKHLNLVLRGQGGWGIPQGKPN